MSSIQDISIENTVNLLFTNSSKAELFVYDRVKETCKATRDSVFEIDSKKGFTDMLEIINMQPFLALRWVVILDYSKLKSMCKTYKGIFQMETSYFLVKVDNYRDYKEFKTLVGSCNDMYLAYIRNKDASFIFRDFNLSQKTVNFIQSSYASDVEKVFELRDYLVQGNEIETPKDVVNAIGSSGGTVAKLALQLLNTPPSTTKGFNMVVKRRLQTILDLCNTYGVSSTRNFLLASVQDILDIKTLYMQGIIFKKIRDIPSKYNDKRLLKYQYCISTITEEIPYTRILKLYTLLKSEQVWKNKQDILIFVYSYYKF